MRRAMGFLLIFLSVCLLFAACATAAGAAYLSRYAGQTGDSKLPEYRLCGQPAVLYAYDPEERADRSGEPHPAAGGEVCPERLSVYVPYDDFPPHLVAAFVAIEDKRFFSHAGVDLLRTAEAGLNYISGQGRSFGASTITQQLIKNLTGRDEYTLDRKFTEIFQALELEKQADKSEILEAYLNIINLAHGCWGVGAAAAYYFSKTVPELTLAECACLAAITNNPTRYDPVRHPEDNKARRALILSQMQAQGYITEGERLAAMTTGVALHLPNTEEETVSSWYTDMVISDVIRDLQQRLGYTAEQASLLVYAGGLKIYTAMDETLQGLVEDYYRDTDHFPAGEQGQPQSALILIDLHTGDILAVAGAVGEKQGNRVQNFATDTRRPAGSAIKPLSVFAPALERGLITWASVFDDEPVSSRSGVPWPRNADGLYRGRTTVAYALAHSLNTVSVRLLDQVGMEDSFTFLHDTLHMTSLRPAGDGRVNDMTISSLALGQQSRGVTVRELTAAYTIFEEGVYHAPVSYHKVVDQDGRVLLENQPGGEVVLSRESAGLMTQMLRGVVSAGTANRLTFPGDSGIQAAGKTGTTQNNCDRWFIGYTPRLLCGVWMGYEYPMPLDGTEGNPCLGVWDSVMTACEQAYTGAPEKTDFTLPADLIRVTYCRTTGRIPSARCAEEDRLETGWFVRGTQPTDVCHAHGVQKEESRLPEDGSAETVLPETEPVATEFTKPEQTELDTNSPAETETEPPQTGWPWVIPWRDPA